MIARDRISTVEALSALRSRRGYEGAERSGVMSDPSATADAWLLAANPMTLAYLAPSVAADTPAAPGEWSLPMEELLAGPLKRTLPGSARHHALVEAMRRLYRSRAMAADRADKERAARRPR